MKRTTKTKILYTTGDASPQSGASHSLLYMSREVSKWGYEPLLALPVGDGSQPVAGTKVGVKGQTASYTLPLPRPTRGQSPAYYLNYFRRNTQTIYQLATLIRREQIALVHANEIFDVYAAIAARLAGVPCVWHIRADLSAAPLLQPILPRISAALSNVIIAVSDSVHEHMFRRQGIDTRKIAVVYNPGPDFSLFHPAVNGTAVRQEFGLPADAFLVVLVAKLSERKGHEVFVRAAPQVLAAFPNAYFLLVGGELEGRHHQMYAQGLKALPQQLHVEDRVIFTGYRPDIPQIMAAADIVTHCSTYPDPFPGVVLQGMAVGKPVIASDCGGPREQIENHVSGVLVEPSNPTALAAAICTLLGDKEKQQALGQVAANRVRTNFTAEAFFQKLSTLYDGLVPSALNR